MLPSRAHIVNLIMVIEIKALAPLDTGCNKPEDAIINFFSSAVKTNRLTSRISGVSPLADFPHLVIIAT